MAGFVYVMSNPGFDGRVKIGKSSKDPTADRVGELNNTSSVPEPFKVEYYCYVEKFDQLETKVHRLLDDRRPNKKREFFKIELWDAVDTIKEVATELGGIKFEEFFFDYQTKAAAVGPWDQAAIKGLYGQEIVGGAIEHDTWSSQSNENFRTELSPWEKQKKASAQVDFEARQHQVTRQKKKKQKPAPFGLGSKLLGFIFLFVIFMSFLLPAVTPLIALLLAFVVSWAFFALLNYFRN